jgi:hypothetical protein
MARRKRNEYNGYFSVFFRRMKFTAAVFSVLAIFPAKVFCVQSPIAFTWKSQLRHSCECGASTWRRLFKAVDRREISPSYYFPLSCTELCSLADNISRARSSQSSGKSMENGSVAGITYVSAGTMVQLWVHSECALITPMNHLNTPFRVY